MKTKAVRLHGENDLRLEALDLPPLKDDEILARVISDSICMSSYKATVQGARHKRVPNDVAEHPIVIGHETAGEIVEVGAKWRDKFAPGGLFGLQPAIDHPAILNGLGGPGYSYEYMGGAATYVVIPKEVMEQDCLLPYNGPAFYLASLAEPMSTIVGTFHAMYHTEKFKYEHLMGIVEGGNLAILAGAGPMGLGAVDYAIHNDRKPGLIVVTDIDADRLARAERLIPPSEAERHGVTLHYVNTGAQGSGGDPIDHLTELSGSRGFDDVLVFAPVPAVFEQADRILAYDGCLNFFAGPTDPGMSAKLNIYDVHYSSHHVMGTSGGGTGDMKEALDLMSDGRINPSAMITHVGGLDATAETTQNLPNIPGGKKLIYPGIALELTAIDEFVEKGSEEPLFAELARITERHNGLWSPDAERYLLENAPSI
jgi:threonine dehydrogenase-like Zn-dependent dehydrogenase